MINRHFKRVLITGTTSGLGKAFHQYYAELGTEVIEVNRRALGPESEFPIVHSEVLDITNAGEVYSFLFRLKRSDLLPDLFILNAGVNLVDNLDIFDYNAFSKVMNTNLNGVLTFVSAIQRLGLGSRTIATISSTSNIISNPAHIAYHLSKLNLHRAFQMLSTKDSMNHYKSVVLGPVHTNIQAHYPAAQGFQKHLLNFLAIDSGKAASACAAFFSSNRSVFHFPKFACAFYYIVKFMLLFFPFLYRGTQSPALSKPVHA